MQQETNTLENQKQDEILSSQKKEEQLLNDGTQVENEIKLIPQKKKAMKAVRFNIEGKPEKIVKIIKEFKPVGENKCLFPPHLPASNINEGSQNSINEANSLNKDDLQNLESAYTDKELEEMEQIKKWLFANLQRDVENAKKNGAKPLELKVKNFMLIRKENNEKWNRVEFDTSFDFQQIETILISPEEDHPTQVNLKYATIVLFGKNKNIPMIFPYCYHKEKLEEIEQGIDSSKNKKEKNKLKKKLKKKLAQFKPNELDNWIFVNSQLKEACHKINEFNNI